MRTTAGSRDHPELVGRQVEMGRIRDWSSRIADGATALVLDGAPGMGKTALWQRAIEDWRGTNLRSLVTQPTDEGLSAPLSGLADLFSDDPTTVEGLISEEDPIWRGRVTLEGLRRILADGPTLIAIDDSHLLDSASARAIRFAIRRLDEEPAGFIITLPSGTVPDPIGLPGLLPPGRVERLSIGPMGRDDLRALVGRVRSTISPVALEQIREISGGNPLFALELSHTMASAPYAAEEEMSVLPSSLQGAIEARVAASDGPRTELLRLVGTAGQIGVGDLRIAMPRIDLDRMVDAAVEDGLLIVDADGTVRIAHPIIASVVYRGMDPETRTSQHAKLARITVDDDVRAFHIARSLTGQDAGMAQLIEEAAARADHRDAFSLAADLSEASLNLTPREDSKDRVRRALAVITYTASAGEIKKALEQSDQLIASLPPGPHRAEALICRSQLEDDDLAEGESLLLRALDDAGDDLPLRGRVLDQLGWLTGVFRGDLPTGIVYARQAVDIAATSGDREFEMSAAAGLSNMEALAGADSVSLMNRAVAIEDEIGRPPLWAGPRVLLAEQLLWSGDLVGARSLLEEAVTHADLRNHERWRPYSLYDLAALECTAGNLGVADELLTRAMESARDCEDAHVESWIFYRLSLVYAWLGRSDAARAAATNRLQAATARGERTGIARARSVLGLLALSEGELATAVDELAAAVELLEEIGLHNPGAVPALPDAIEAHCLWGDISSAERMVDLLEGHANTIDTSWAHAAATKARGTLAAYSDDPGGPALLEEAVSDFHGLGYRPDAARASLMLGRCLRRNGQRSAAGDVLAGTRDEFISMGARHWASRATEELERAAPGRASGELTSDELDIAHLVATGKRNGEIADELFMSQATVEAHLTRIYRKLAIRSRSELTRLVIEGSTAIGALPTDSGPDF